MTGRLQVTYIHHSSFLVETASHTMLFDYFRGDLPPVRREKPLWIFASHAHSDHYVPGIFRLSGLADEVHYVLSDDIPFSDVPETLREQTAFLGSGYTAEGDGIRIRTFDSTDQGVAFLVESGGQVVYHAGDLSVWNVGENGQEVYRDIYTGGYKKQIRHLENKHIDIGFVVLDPRMGAGAYAGIDYFAETVDCDLIFPMHCWEDYSIIEKCKRRPQMARFKNKIVDIDRDNIIYDID